MIRSGALCVLVAVVCAGVCSAAEPEVLEVRQIWGKAPHSAFTDLIRYDGRWFCTFREGQGHVSPDGSIRVITSRDSVEWDSAAHITSDTADLRDPKLCVAEDGRLMLNAAAAPHKPREEARISLVWFSENGRDWTDAVRVIDDKSIWLWRVTWHEGKAYGTGYWSGGGPEEQRQVHLYRSETGKEFTKWVPGLFTKGFPNEATLRFLEDDTALCLLRRDGSGGTAQIGRSEPPYKEWTWKDTGVKVGGPNFIRLPDGRFVAAVRLYDGGARTALCWMDPEAGTLKEFLKLPSGGDTSYAGLVWHDGLLWVSYYSSHEGKTRIYVAKVKI